MKEKKHLETCINNYCMDGRQFPLEIYLHIMDVWGLNGSWASVHRLWFTFQSNT